MALARAPARTPSKPQDDERAGVGRGREDRRQERARRWEPELDQRHDALVDVQFRHPLGRVGEVAQDRREPLLEEHAVGIVAGVVDRALGLGARAREVQDEAAAGLGQRDALRVEPGRVDAVVLGVVLPDVGAVGNPGEQLPPECLGRPREDRLEARLDLPGAVPTEEGTEPGSAEAARRHLAVEIPTETVGEPRVPHQDPEHVPVRPARVVELDRRDHQPFLVGARRVGRHRARHGAADIVVVPERLDERDHPIFLMGVEDGHGHAEIREVADPALRLVDVVVEVDVARPHRRERKVPHDRLDEGRVRAARELPTPPVVDAGPEVPRLPDHRRAGSPLDGRLDLRLDRGQRPLHDLEDDRVRAGPGAGGPLLPRRDARGVAPRRMPGPVHASQDHVAERVDLDPLAGKHDRRGTELLYDRRPGQAIAGLEPCAIVHDALDVSAPSRRNSARISWTCGSL